MQIIVYGLLLLFEKTTRELFIESTMFEIKMMLKSLTYEVKTFTVKTLKKYIFKNKRRKKISTITIKRRYLAFNVRFNSVSKESDSLVQKLEFQNRA